MKKWIIFLFYFLIAGCDREKDNSYLSAEKAAEYFKSIEDICNLDNGRLWGKNLYVHLNDVYKNKAKFCLMVISNSYKDKQWTNHERMAAQARAFSQNKEYILPLKLDDTEIPGLNETIGYVDYRQSNSEEVVNLLKDKLKE